MEPDTQAQDRGEFPSLMEPLVITGGSRHRAELMDLAFELTHKFPGKRAPRPAGGQPFRR
jgi:hypothetical protein